MTLEAGRAALDSRRGSLLHAVSQIERQLAAPTTQPHQANARKARLATLKAELAFVHSVIDALDAD